MIKSIPRVEREAAFRKIKDSQYGVFKNASDGSIKLVVNAAAASGGESQRENQMTDPISPSERLKRLHDAQMTAARIKYLRLRELRGWLMTDAEMREHHRIDREDEKDREDERQGDWTR